MNKINQLFANRGERKLLSLYFCAGCPTLDNTGEVIKTMQQRGIDMIEVGIPFSDPMADGPVIQDAATRALRNGMSLRVLFEQLRDIRHDVDIPLILMGYMNPVLHYGFEAFCQKCAEVGIDGIILPDLPFQDYIEHFKPIADLPFKDYLDYVKPVADRYDLRIIMLITPETSEERIRFIDQHTDGFIYMVSSAAITGAQREFDAQKQAYFNKVHAMQLQHPTMIGFGISNRQTLQSAQANASGAIIGSKFVQLLDAAGGDAQQAIDQLFEALKQ